MPQAVAAGCWSAARLSAGGGAVLGFAWSPDPCLTPPPHSSFPGSRVQLPACAVCPGSLGFPVFLGVWVESGGVCAPILCSKTTSAVVAARAGEVLTSAVGGGGQGSGALPSAACSSPPQGGPAASPSPPYATPPCRVMGAWASGPSQAGAQAPGPSLPRVPPGLELHPAGPGGVPPTAPDACGHLGVWACPGPAGWPALRAPGRGHRGREASSSGQPHEARCTSQALPPPCWAGGGRRGQGPALGARRLGASHPRCGVGAGPPRAGLWWGAFPGLGEEGRGGPGERGSRSRRKTWAGRWPGGSLF